MRSYPADYDLIKATDLGAALELLVSPEGWRPIAGGTDLMVLFNAGRLPYRRLVSVRDIPELRRIETTGTEVRIGAAVTYSQIRQSPILQADFPLLSTAAGWTGGIANQNRGTLGGNVANASPAADSSPALLVYDADLRLVSARGERWVPYREFHIGYKQMQIRPDELIHQFRLPRRNGWRQYSRKVGTRKAQAISKVCMAAAADLDGDVIRDLRIAVASVAPIPFRCTTTEDCLRGARLGSGRFSEAREVLRREIHPITDIRSTDQYRGQVSANLLGEFLESLR
jgi:CO/xanthine dehydrogenase FAD-binding subunit